MYADERAAWEGPHQDHPDINVRIEAAAFKGRPVHFNIIFPWDKPVLQQRDTLTRGERAAAIMLAAVFLGILIGAALLGRHNLRLGRSDNKGAFRLALFVFATATVGSIIGAPHVPVLSEELGLVYHIAAIALFSAALIWLLYIALEPHVRRRWPKLIISWSRLMSGGFRDPMVGRDLLIGGLLGLVHSAIISLGFGLPRWLGLEGRPGIFANPINFTGMRSLLWFFLVSNVVISIFVGFAFLFLLLLLLIMLRNQRVAIVGLFLVTFTIEALAFASSGPKLYWIASMLISVLVAITVSRFGLLATMAFQLFFFLTLAYPLTSDFSVWYAEGVVFPLAIILALTIYGFYTSLGGQAVFKGSLLKE
jgi:serine/threonine-protein kinase